TVSTWWKCACARRAFRLRAPRLYQSSNCRACLPPPTRISLHCGRASQASYSHPRSTHASVRGGQFYLLGQKARTFIYYVYRRGSRSTNTSNRAMQLPSLPLLSELQILLRPLEHDSSTGITILIQ